MPGKVTLMFTPALARWLADSGLRNLPQEELIDGFSRRLNEAGVPVARVFVSWRRRGRDRAIRRQISTSPARRA